MKSLVISGGGSKGAFAGGVAEYFLEKKNKNYDLFIGTSTGSLMISHLALGKVNELKEIYTNVDQNSIFSNNPFIIKNIRGEKIVNINHFNVLWNFLMKRKTFGESKNLRQLIKDKLPESYFKELVNSNKNVVVTVSNLTMNCIEYKSVKDCTYNDFCDWIWASCNHVPFMSLMEKNNCQYADGGFGALSPIKEAINRGATEVDAIILQPEINQINRLPDKNSFSLISTIFQFMLVHVAKQNINIGKLTASNKNVNLNLYYTPTVLTTDALIFDKKLMKKWWEMGYQYAENKDQLNDSSEIQFD